MSILQGVGALISGGSTTGAASAFSTAVPATPFAGVLKGMVTETNDLSAKAQQAVSGLLSGKGVDVHEAMIAMQKADMAFDMAMQVRSKAVGAYQQMMGMQF
jgi:flagellar hook-basal body complex protein FliE